MAEAERNEEQEEMLDQIFGDDVVEEEPVEQEEQVEEQQDEPEPDQESEPEEAPEPEEEEPSEEPVEEPDIEQPDASDVADDGPVDDDSFDELAALREQNEALLAHVESLSGQVVGGISQTPQAPAAAEQPKAPAAAVPKTPSEVMNFLENTSIDDLLEDPTKFNSVLNNVAMQAKQSAQQEVVQQVLRSVPELVMGYITRHSAMNRMADDFYRENSDLVNVKQTVAAVANDIHAKNPELGVEDVFKQSAEQTRKLLGIKQAAQKAAKQRPTKPAFAKAGGARKKAAPVSALQRELDELFVEDF